MWHKGIPSSPGLPSVAKAAKPIPFLQTYTAGNSSFCHWTIHERGGKEKKGKKHCFLPPFYRKGIHQLLFYLTSKWKRQETRLFPHCISRERKQDRKRAGSSQQKVRGDAKLLHVLMLFIWILILRNLQSSCVKRTLRKQGGRGGVCFLNRSTYFALFCICMLCPKCYTIQSFI